MITNALLQVCEIIGQQLKQFACCNAGSMLRKQTMRKLTLAPPARRDNHAENGFVLLIVLWWLTFLVFLSMEVTASTRTSLLISGNLRNSAVAEAQADGAINDAIFHVLARQWKADGATHVIAGAQAVAEVRINDEGGRIDPNVAPMVLMQALLRECGATAKAAVDLATAIYEWRSLDLLRSASTAEAARYRTRRSCLCATPCALRQHRRTGPCTGNDIRDPRMPGTPFDCVFEIGPITADCGQPCRPARASGGLSI